MTKIRTRQVRAVRSRIGTIMVEKIYFDRPASLETWIENCGAIAAEFGVDWLTAHDALAAQLPELFGT